MQTNIKNKNKILNISITGCSIVLVFLLMLSVSNGSLEGIMGNSVYDNENYNIGNKVNYANNNWYIISENDKSVTLLKETSLSKNEIESLGLSINVSEYGQVAYDYNNQCNDTDDSSCTISLNDSQVGRILEAWQKQNLNIDELITVDDYTIRLINNDDVDRLENNAWLYLSQYYWTMISPNYSGSNIYGLYPDHQLHMQMVYDGTNDISGGLVRPVINVNKKVLSKTNIY